MGLASRRRPLAACVALATGGIALAAGPPGAIVGPTVFQVHSTVPSGAIVVANCDDTGAGSLRDAVATAASGATIDLTQLSCSTITLATGAIVVAQDDLSLIGPGAGSLAIDGAGQSGVLHHTGAGTLLLDSLSLTRGYLAQYHARGGGVFSAGNVALYHGVVSDCTVYGYNIRGGGIFATHDLTIDDSLITRNLSDGGIYEANGGGFFVGGYLRMRYSTVTENEARASGSAPSGGGGGATFGDVLIVGSTISGNRAKDVAGIGLDGHGSAVIVDSTVSGNIAGISALYGGIYAGVPVSIYNSTIAFNGGTGLAAGYGVHLESTIIADNVTDFVLFAGSVSGTHNLIVHANVVPADTLRDCPRLQPLADNGGPTRTHALIHASPAIDAGNNVMALADDQRGAGFPRVFGAEADIGAFEWQGTDDAIFSSGFESGCDR